MITSMRTESKNENNEWLKMQINKARSVPTSLGIDATACYNANT